MSAKASQAASSAKQLPKMTESSSDEYVDKMSSISAYAMLPNPRWRLMFATTDQNRHQTYYDAIKEYIGYEVKQGGFIMESGDFAACASWQPPGSHTPPQDAPTSGDPAGSSAEEDAQTFIREHVWEKYGQEFWRLLLLARDPDRENVPGAVRAVIWPVVERARAEGKPIYLCTTSEHARDIYLHWGWRVVRTEVSQGLPAWDMILYPPENGDV